MTQPANTEQLLIVAASLGQKHTTELVQQLAKISSLDAYTLKQRLTGSGLAQLTTGTATELQALAQLLRQYHVRHWIIPPPLPQFTPQLINGVTISAEHIVFHSNKIKQQGSAENITLERGARLQAVVADLSGQVAEKLIKRLLVHSTYGGGAPATMTSSEIQQEIFKHAPVIDLYWYGDDGEVTQGARILPGSFDHRQLGAKANLSRNGNLLNLLETIADYAGKIDIDVQFGLGFLPTCRMHPSPDPLVQRENLVALTSYGWLILALAKQSDNAPAANSAGAEILTAIGLEQLAEPIISNITSPDTTDETDHTASAATRLPAPPEVKTKAGLKLYFSFWRVVAACAGILIIIISERHESLATFIYKNGIVTGLIPALICGWSLWGAIHFWRLKNRIENTPTSKARSAAMGMIEVHGQAKRLYALVSPISQLPCVYYCLKKYQRRNRDNQWRLSSVTSSGNISFILEDDSGQIRIDPQGATLSPQHKTEGFPGQSNILFTSGQEANPYEKWQEEVLHEGCNLYVMGFAHAIKTNGSEPIHRRVAQKLRALKRDRAQLMRYDNDGDGNIDAGEWDQARSDMEQQALQERLTTGQQRSNQQLIIGRPPQKGLPFIIAETTAESKLTGKYAWYVPLLLSTALATLIWALINVNHYFQLL
jgi:hypothetical protein